jgi:hypothetical protein
MLDNMTYDDLAMFEKELASGKMRKHVRHRMRSIARKGMKICPVCGSEIDVTRYGHFALDFGPVGFRKRAHFDGVDCLEYFIARLKDHKRKGSQ